MNRRSRAGEIVDFIDLNKERKRHVVPHQLKSGMSEKMLDVALLAGKKIVHA
jgi:hypothetical protein